MHLFLQFSITPSLLLIRFIQLCNLHVQLYSFIIMH